MHTHREVVVEAIPPTCIADGSTEGIYCEECGETIKAVEQIPAMGHNMILVQKTEPSCTSDGIVLYKCKDCNVEHEQTEAALGHQLTDGEVKKSATCTESGIEGGVCLVCNEYAEVMTTPLSHTPGSRIDIEGEFCGEIQVGHIYCTLCDNLLYTLGHDYEESIVAADCENNGMYIKKCRSCGDEIIKILYSSGHFGVEWETVTESTCTEAGEEALKCISCEVLISTRAIEAHEHSYTQAFENDILTHTCEKCNNVKIVDCSDIEVFKITFEAYLDEENILIYVPEGEEVTLPTPEREGYIFAGWYKDENFTIQYNGEELTENETTLYAKWLEIEKTNNETHSGIEIGVDTDFSFTVESEKKLTNDNINENIEIFDEYGNQIDVTVIPDTKNENNYTITPENNYTSGWMYTVKPGNDVTIPDRPDDGFSFTVGGENTLEISFKSDVVFISKSEVYFGYTADSGNHIILINDSLDAEDAFVIYGSDKTDIKYAGIVASEQLVDGMFLYTVKETDAETLDNALFNDVNVYYKGEIDPSNFIINDAFAQEYVTTFKRSRVYNALLKTAETFTTKGEFGDYYYEFAGFDELVPKFTNKDGTLTVSLEIVANFQRMNTETRKVEDFFKITLGIVTTAKFDVECSIKGFSNSRVIISENSTIKASITANLNNKKDTQYFKDLFNKILKETVNTPLATSTASAGDSIMLGKLPFSFWGITLSIDVNANINFDMVGEVGIETKLDFGATVGIEISSWVPRAICNFHSDAYFSVYGYAKVGASAGLDFSFNISIWGLIKGNAGISPKIYAEIGGMISFSAGTGRPAAVAINGYFEGGFKVNTYVNAEILGKKKELHKGEKSYTLWKFGEKQLPICFEYDDGDLTCKLDIGESVSLFDISDISIHVQDLGSLKIKKVQLEPGNEKLEFEITEGVGIVDIDSEGNLTLLKADRDTEEITVKVKFTYDNISKESVIKIRVEHKNRISVSYIAPTCTSEGRTAYVYCDGCELVLEGENERIEMLPHDFTKEVISKTNKRTDVSCTVKESYWYLCTDCDTASDTDYFNVGDYAPHTYSDPFTCHDRSCTVCGFVCIATTEHRFTEWIEVEEGACTDKEYKVRACYDCGYAESDLPDSSVRHHAYSINIVHGNCTEHGYVICECANCGDKKIIEDKTLRDHNFDFIITEDRHYEECVYEDCNTQRNEGAHVSSGASCDDDEICTICGYVIKRAVGHDYVTVPAKTATCTETGNTEYLECSVCKLKQGYKNYPALSHDYSVTFTWNGFESAICTAVCKNDPSHTDSIEARITVASTLAKCEKDGKNVYTAKAVFRFGTYTDIKEDIIYATGHTTVTVESVLPTCTKDGREAYTECSTCGEILSGGNSIPKLGHTPGEFVTVKEATCYSTGKKEQRCTICNEIVGTQILESTGHKTAERVISEPTCTEDGTVEKYCKFCEISLDKYHTDKLGHLCTSYTTVKAATCTESGLETGTCERCGAEIRREIEKLPHSELHHTGQEATCTEDGWDDYVTCAVCDYTTYKKISAKGHSNVTDPEKAPTCTESGLSEGKHCSVCGTVTKEQKTIDALGHNYSEELCRWTWSEDCSSAEVKLICERNRAHAVTLSATVSGSVIIEPNCENDGSESYTATVTYEGKTYEDNRIEYTYAEGHKYAKPTFIWNETDHSKPVTVKSTCSVCRGNYENTVIPSSRCTASCTKDGVTVYTVQDLGYTDTREDLAKALGHDYKLDTSTWEWASDYSSAKVKIVCKTDTAHSLWLTDGSPEKDDTSYPASCTAAGKIIYTATVSHEGKTYPSSIKTVPVAKLSHSYAVESADKWIWTESGESYTCKLKLVCASCSASETKNATVTLKSETEPDCEKGGTKVYLASYTYSGKTYTGEKEVTIPASAHSYTAPTWSWADDYSSAKATYSCTACKKTFTSSSITPSVDKTEPTCTRNGKYVYTVKITLGTTVYEDTASQIKTATGHRYAHSGWEWADDYSKAVAVFTCQNDRTHTEERLDLSPDKTVISTVSCVNKGVTKYYASVEFDGQAYTSETTAETPALGHNWTGKSWEWSGYSAATLHLTCSRGCKADVAATVTTVTDTRATCTASGQKTHTASVTYSGKTYKDTKTEAVDALGHYWANTLSYSDTQHYYECERDGCDEKKSIASHTLKLSSATEKIVMGNTTRYIHSIVNKCTVCGYSYLVGKTEEVECSNVGLIDNKEPTCTEPGFDYGLWCYEHNHVYQAQNIIPALGHDYAPVARTEPTCYSEGVVEHYRCRRCGLLFDTEKNPITSAVLPMLNHRMATDDGGEIEIDFTVTYSLSEYSALHAIGTPPTCQTVGEAYFTCTICEKTVSGVTVTGEHGYDGYESDAEYHWQKCTHCDATTDKEAHDFGTDEVCTVCEYTDAVEGSVGLEYDLSYGKTYYSVSGIGTCTDLDIVIPAKYKGLPVKEIEYGAFQYCTNITSVVIPNSVTSIGDKAFYECSSLTSINIPNGVTSIALRTFSGCSSLTSINIPEGVTYIGNSAFSGCSSLTSINIPEGVTSIGDSEFSGCSSLTSINIPEGVTSIGSYAFYGCSSLTSINIPEGVTYIDRYAFSHCSSLTSINIPDRVTSIDYATFSHCSSLTSITIPESVTSIGDDAFVYCSSLTSITIPDTVTSIGDWAFYGCIRFTSIHYTGTTSQWNAITKDPYWDYDTPKYTVYCSDGNITKE